MVSFVKFLSTICDSNMLSFIHIVFYVLFKNLIYWIMYF